MTEKKNIYINFESPPCEKMENERSWVPPVEFRPLSDGQWGVGHWPGESSEVWIRCYASQTCIFTFINIPHATKDHSSLVD